MRRYDKIMQAIGLGLSDSMIAERYSTDSATIHVYRMVHDGNLPVYTMAEGKHDYELHWRWRRGCETIADRLARTIKGWHA